MPQLLSRSVLPALLLFAACTPVVYAAGLPDTGQSQCDDGSNNMVPCSSANSGDAATMPRQDGRFGRDPVASGKGFDYTKVCNSGELAGSGSCPVDPPLGPGADEWACTLDNITGLMWEVKVNDNTHLRHRDWSYTWYDSNPDTNGGDAGLADTGAGVGSDNCLDVARCDTEKFIDDVNSANLCGHSDWRLPSGRELLSIVDYGTSSPAIVTTYFPNAGASSGYWSASTYVWNPAMAFEIYFVTGPRKLYSKTNTSIEARLVRGEQF